MEALSLHGSAREELIDIGEESTRNYWASQLGTSMEKLKTAVRATHSLEFQTLKKYIDSAQKALKNSYAKNYAPELRK